MIFASKFLEIYYHMLQARYLEEALVEENKKGKTYGPLHLCLGQEAAAAACGPLTESDVITTTHRCHAHYLGRGMDLRKLCCEIFGKKEGYGKGRAGHLLIWDREHGILGATGIVGGTIPIAVGQALSFKLRGEKRVVVSFFGDGASNTGSFHESLNMAAKWKLPVVFYCENNQYGLTVHVDVHLSVKDISDRARAYGIPGITVFGNDMVGVYNIVDEAVSRARSGDGPMLIEAKTYRMLGFSINDAGGYQREEEIKHWKDNDPIDIGEKLLIDQGECSKEEIGKLKIKALNEVKEAIIYAENAPYPEPLDLPNDIFQREEGRQ